MCLSPVSLTREIAGRKYTQVVPCGKCVECLKKEQNEFVVRCEEAARQYGNVWFITLTYNEDNVPVRMDAEGEIDYETGEVLPVSYRSLDREDIRKWKKRVKQAFVRKHNQKLDLHYLICGEYGPQTHRPHYHGMFFGLTDEVAHMLEEDWKKHYGHTYFRKVPTIPINGRDQVKATARYAAKYCVKIKELEDPLVNDGIVEKPRKIVSQYLGQPSAQRFLAMERFYLAKDLYGDYNKETVLNDLSKSKFERLIKEIKKRRKEKPLARYLLKKIFYKKTEDGQYKATLLQKMVSKSLQMDIQKDYSRQLAQMADNLNLPEDNEGYRIAAKNLSRIENMMRQSRAEAIISTNMDYMRRSKL